jgi:hypothetical protein
MTIPPKMKWRTPKKDMTMSKLRKVAWGTIELGWLTKSKDQDLAIEKFKKRWGSEPKVYATHHSLPGLFLLAPVPE